MNWKAQTLPIIINGLPSRASLSQLDTTAWNSLHQPQLEEIRKCSPLAQVRARKYITPTFIVHGTADDLIPWQQSQRTVDEMLAHGIDARLILVDGAPHICDSSRDLESDGWRAVVQAYEWLRAYAFMEVL